MCTHLLSFSDAGSRVLAVFYKKKEEKPSGAAKAEKEDNVELESEDVNEGEEGTTSAKPETTKPA